MTVPFRPLVRHPIVRRLIWLALVRLAFITILLAVFFVGMRRNIPWIVDAVRRFNHKVMNPKVLGTAGRTGSPIHVIEHVGRATGTSYRTPITTVETDEGFAVLLPYGTRADWTQNVLAAGTATLVRDGREHRVHRPEIVDAADAITFFGPNDRRAQRAFRVDEVLVLRSAP